MSIVHKENIFSSKELDKLNSLINKQTIPTLENGEYAHFFDNGGTGLCKNLGRLQIGDILRGCEQIFRDRICEIAYELTGLKLAIDHGGYSEYSNKYGSPNLPPHFDGDTNNIIINFQLSSNTSWGIGVGTEVYYLQDNSAVVFNGNTNIHWRPIKNFKDGEYVRMIFFRLYDPDNRPDYSGLPPSQDHEVFAEVRNIRNAMAEQE